MNLDVKIMLYSIGARVMFLLAVLSSLMGVITSAMTAGSLSPSGILAGALKTPFFWIAVVLLWRFIVNKKIRDKKKYGPPQEMNPEGNQ